MKNTSNLFHVFLDIFKDGPTVLDQVSVHFVITCYQGIFKWFSVIPNTTRRHLRKMFYQKQQETVFRLMTCLINYEARS